MNQVTFDNPLAFLLLLLVVLLIYIKHRRGRGGKFLFAFSNWEGQGFYNPPSILAVVYMLSQFFSWIGFILIIFALAGPSTVSKEKIFISRGIDIMLVIDISPSMAAQDFAGMSRIESSQETILRFVDRRNNDPIGLTGFGSQAALRVPPTLNYDYVKEQVKALQVMALGEGTALGMGITLASFHLRSSSASQKVMILFTDGENNAGEIEPESAATIAAEAGIRIYVIDISSDRETVIEFTDPTSGTPYRARYQGEKQGELLQSIADISGGEYFTATDPLSLEGVLLSVDSLERVETRLKVGVSKEPQHQQFILIAFILIFLDYFLRKMVLRELL